MGWTVYNSDGKILQSAELADGAVTFAKLATSSITGAPDLGEAPATGDSLLVSDTSASAALKEITVANLFAAPAITGNATAITQSASNNSTRIATTAYVDAQVTAQDLDATTDSGTIDIDLDSETLTIAGGEGIDTSASGTTITIAGEEASTSNKGVASFHSDNFAVSSGVVTIKNAGVAIAEIATTAGTAGSGTFLRGDGQWQAAGGGDMVLINSVEATDVGSITLTGLDTSVYDYFDIGFAGFRPEEDNRQLYIRFGDSSGLDSGASDYAYVYVRSDENGTRSASYDLSESKIILNSSIGNATDEGFSGTFTMNTGNLTMNTTIHGPGMGIIFNNTISYFMSYGMRHTPLVVTQILVGFTAGEIATGRLTVWGRKHA